MIFISPELSYLLLNEFLIHQMLLLSIIEGFIVP